MWIDDVYITGILVEQLSIRHSSKPFSFTFRCLPENMINKYIFVFNAVICVEKQIEMYHQLQIFHNFEIKKKRSYLKYSYFVLSNFCGNVSPNFDPCHFILR